MGLLALLWFALTRIFAYVLEGNALCRDYPVLDCFAFFHAGAGHFVALAYLLPAISAVVAGFFLDDAAEIVERTDYGGDPPGQALSVGASLLQGLRFAALSLVFNLAALTLFFIPLVNVAAFFAVNAYLFGREYFELAAGRFRSAPEASAMRLEHRVTVWLAGAMIAALILVPVLNLLTPLFGVALMVHVHKRLSARALSYRRADEPALEAGRDLRLTRPERSEIPGRPPTPSG